jgi:PAS domain S-box-containing protein
VVVPPGRPVVSDDRDVFRQLVENSSDVLARHGPDGTYRYVAPVCRELLGYEPAELVGRSAYELVHPEDVPVVERSHAAVLSDPIVHAVVYRIRHRSGAYRWFESTAHAIVDPATGEVIEIQTSSRDVTARETAEAQLRESEHRFRLAMANAPIGMAVVGLDGRFLDVNERLCEFLGRSHDELAGLGFQDITHSDDLHTDVGYAHQLLLGQIQHYEMEKRYLLPSGAAVWALLSGSLVRDDKGEPRYFIAQIVDIDARKRTLLALEETGRQLARSNAELGRYAAVVAHDLRSPLATLGGFLQLLHTRCAERLDEQADQVLELSLALTTQMAESVEGLLALTRVERGPSALEGIIALDEVVDEAVAALGATLASVPCSLKVGDLPRVHGDRTQLRLLFQNLLANALKFRDPDRELVVTIEAFHEPPRWHLVVADNGRGLDPADREVVFEPFSRVLDTDDLGAAGLGLATCRRIVERHGGELTAHPTDPGVRFEFSLPEAGVS